MSKLIKKEFTSSGSWTAPAGITRVTISGWAGGGGGDQGNTGITDLDAGSDGGAYGSGSVNHIKTVDVVPNTTYTVTIGAGGSGGSGSGPGFAGPTSFGSLFTVNGGGDQYGRAFFSASSTIEFFGSSWGEWYSGDMGTGNTVGGGGGQGGGPGAGAVGGNGGNYSETGTATAGASPAANTGAGGGGGGATNSGTAGNGGAGGSGYLEISWVE